jgi:hypothetical protein
MPRKMRGRSMGMDREVRYIARSPITIFSPHSKISLSLFELRPPAGSLIRVPDVHRLNAVSREHEKPYTKLSWLPRVVNPTMAARIFGRISRAHASCRHLTIEVGFSHTHSAVRALEWGGGIHFCDMIGTQLRLGLARYLCIQHSHPPLRPRLTSSYHRILPHDLSRALTHALRNLWPGRCDSTADVARIFALIAGAAFEAGGRRCRR